MSKPGWLSKAPLHGIVDEDGQILWTPSQATFDAEIRAAKYADLCWAYLAYGRDHKVDLDAPMMKGLGYHRRSEIKELVPYTLILSAGVMGLPGDYELAVTKVLFLMQDSNYKRVIVRGKGRPLLLFLYDEDGFHSSFGGSLQDLRGPFDLLREKARQLGIGDPYVVVLAWSGPQAEAIRKVLGADAISRYEAGERAKGATPWADHEANFPREWDAYAAATSAAVVPTLSTGGDIRARCLTPPPWDRGRFPPGGKCEDYAINPTLDELKSEFRDAADWVKIHREKDPANLLLVYSWSECDESGNCLMPTYGDPTGEKIRAIEEALRNGR